VSSYLKWYINDSACDLGFRSTFGAFLKGMFVPGQQLYTEVFYTDALLKKITKHRKMHKVISQLTRSQYRYLIALYADEYQHTYPRAVRLVFENQTGLALCLIPSTAQTPKQQQKEVSDLITLCQKHTNQELQGKEQSQFQQFIEQVNIEYDTLHQLVEKHLKCIP
jgi:hypothetical protein